MRHGSLFSGIGGFDLAAEWMGWENVFHCEWNKFGQQVLKYYWPKAISYEDITKTDFTIHRGRIDILTGGFPCQPYSSAGKRLGKEDERHLWPEMLRAIREIQPRWVVGENVLGLVNWSGGLVFHEVQADLEAEGYEVQPYVLPAASVNAPHRRDRVWFVAHSKHFRLKQREQQGQSRCRERVFEGVCINGYVANSNLHGCNERNGNDEINTSKGRVNALGEIDESNGNGDAADTIIKGLQGCTDSREVSSEERTLGREGDKSSTEFATINKQSNATDTNGIGLRRQSYGPGESRFIGKNEQRNNWQNFPTVSPICTGDDGISDRLDSITFSKWRNESIKAGGNAIVPQVVLQIFKTIEQYENLH